MEVEAHVVTIKNAGLSDDAGLLNPLLEKYKEGCAEEKTLCLERLRSNHL